jgi:hypothetical protein
MFDFIGWIRQNVQPKATHSQNRKDRNRVRLTVETMEERLVPAPVAVNDGTYAALSTEALNVGAPGVLANDIGSNLSATNCSGVTANGNYVALNADGSFTMSPSAGFSGPDSFTYKAFDGSEYSDWATVSINVAWVNQQPSLSAMDPPETDMCPGAVEIPNWASFDPGSPYESQQTVSQYIVSNVSNPGLFSVLPAVDVNGKLTYTVAPYVEGTSTFDVQVKDNGGVENGGQDTSDVSTFTISVLQAPTFSVTNAGNAGAGSLRDGIDRGNAAGRLLTITFNLPGGTDTINLTSALPELRSRFDINGPLAGVTIQRNAAESFRLLHIGVGFTTYITNLSLTNGIAPTNSTSDNQRGGAVFNGGTLGLTNVVIYGNQAADSGGAIYNSGTVGLAGCSVYLNSATNSGGGIHNTGTAFVRLQTHISANTAGKGGGIYNALNATVEVRTYSEVYANNAVGGGTAPNTGAGGGIYNAGTLIMNQAILGWNTSLNQGGGLFSSGTSTLTDVAIQFNAATSNNNGKGGGIYVLSGTTETVSGCTVSGNTAQWNANGRGATVFEGATLIKNEELNTWTDPVYWNDE